MYKFFNDKILKMLIYLVIIEMVLGGLGKLFYLPIRIGLFSVVFIYSCLYIYFNKIRLHTSYYLIISLVILFAAWGGFIGLINGNPLGAIISDANNFIAVLYIVILGAYIRGNLSRLEKITDVFIWLSVGLAVITAGMFFVSYLFLKDGSNVIVHFDNFDRMVNIGLISGLLYDNLYARVYFTTGIYMQVALAITLVRLAKNGTGSVLSKEGIIIAILSLGIFTSSTRGYWMGTAFACFLILIFYFTKVFSKRFLVSLIATVLVFAITFIILPQEVKNEILKRAGTSTDVRTVTGGKNNKPSVKNNDKNNDSSEVEGIDLSNSIRGVQMNHLINKIKEKPVLGWGFGGTIPEYGEETGRGIMNFELYYVELIFKTGIIGAILILAIFGYAFVKLFNALKLKVKGSYQYLLPGWAIGFTSAALSSATNPYFAGAHGFFIIVMFFVAIVETQNASKEYW